MLLTRHWWIVACIVMSAGALSLRQKLINGGRSYGPLLLSDSPTIAELLAHAGYSHIVIDHEHACTDIVSGQEMLRAMDAAASSAGFRTEPIVRVPDHNHVYLKKVLDTMRLPGGILVPMVDDVETAQKVVQATRFPLQQKFAAMQNNVTGGVRGCAVPFIRASSWNYDADYMQKAQQDVLVMVQVESLEGVEAIPDIANVPGVDGIFLGPLDLSCSLGKMGDFEDPEVSGLIRRAEESVKASPAFLAGFRSPGRSVEEMFDSGYSLVCGSIDLGLLREAARQDAQLGMSAVNEDRKSSREE